MCENNQTQITEIHLLGFQGLHNLKILLFVLFLLIYMVIMIGNLLIIVLVTTSDHLNIPMFYFLKHLALADVFLTTNIVPLMLDLILMEERTISFVACVGQLYFFGVCGFVECIILAVMSYDRYLAIRKPLRYSLIMCPDLCMQLVAGCWFLVFVLVSTEIVVLCQLHFCGLNYIDHFFCDFGPFVQLATSDTSALMLLDLIISVLMIFLPFVFIIMTYVSILITILSIPSRTGRKKSFSTCTSHLITVCTYYGTLITVYMIPSEENYFNINKFRSLLYVMVTPMMNPIIYSLRNREVLGALRKVLIFVRKTYG